MSEDGFKVNPQTLRDLASNLQGLGGVLDFIHDGREQLHDAVVLNKANFNGQENVFESAGSALENFAGDWSNGIDEFKKGVKTVASALTGAADGYSQTDMQMASAMNPT